MARAVLMVRRAKAAPVWAPSTRMVGSPRRARTGKTANPDKAEGAGEELGRQSRAQARPRSPARQVDQEAAEAAAAKADWAAAAAARASRCSRWTQPPRSRAARCRRERADEAGRALLASLAGP